MFGGSMLIMEKLLLSYGLVCLSALSLANSDLDSLTKNSHLLPEFEKVEDRHLLFNDDKYLTKTDSDLIANNSNLNLGELLSLSAPITILNYGAKGSTSNIRWRGTTGDHTAILWNGFNMNSISLGEMDLSLVNTESIDEIRIVGGGNSTVFGSGSYAGAINLSNTANWNNKLDLTIGTNLTTFDRYNINDLGLDGAKNSIHLKIGNTKVQYHLNAFNEQIRNHFDFINFYKIGFPVEQRAHDQLWNKGLIQNLFIKLPGNFQLESGLWLQKKTYLTPSDASKDYEGYTTLKDSTTKAYASISKSWNKHKIRYKTAWFNDHMWYLSKYSPIDTFFSYVSNYRNRIFVNELNYGYHFSENWSFNLSANRTGLKSQGSVLNAHDYLAFVFGGVRYKTQKLSLNASVREDFNQWTDPITLFGFGGLVNIFETKFQLKASYSDKFRIPDFNEKYWPGAGNPKLQPEKGWGSDFGFKGMFKLKEEKNQIIAYDFAAFTNTISNFIQWIPSGNISIPVSYKEIWSRGIEGTINYETRLKKWLIEVNENISYTKSTNVKTYTGEEWILGKSLPYIPNFISTTYIKAKRKNFSLNYLIRYNGKQFSNTREDENTIIDHSLIHTIILGQKIKVPGGSLNLLLKINNLFDTPYEIRRLYPMPGRWYELGVKYNITTNNK